MRLRLWPGSLAGRTAVVLVVGLVIVQGLGLTIHALDRLDVQRLAQARDLAVRVVAIYRTMALTDEDRAKLDFLVLLTVQTMNYLHSGRHRVAL